MSAQASASPSGRRALSEVSTVSWATIWNPLRSLGPFGGAGFLIVVVIVVIALAAPKIAPDDPLAFVGGRLESPSGRHWFGTDNFGRDILSRIVYGARLSIVVPLGVLGTATVLGLLFGVPAAVFGGRTDEVLMRIADLFFVFPYLVMALAIGAALQPSTRSTILALGLVWWPTYARLIRAQTLTLRGLPYVEASRSIGDTEWGIVRRHYFPSYVGTLVTKVTTDVGAVIGISAGLSFIGLGSRPPTPEWGLMIADARAYALTAWWTAFFPGAAIFVTIVGFAMLGDQLQDRFERTLSRG